MIKTDQPLIPFKVINKFHNEIREYLANIYGVCKAIPFNDIVNYRKEINKILYDVDDFTKAGFISPDGKLKRVSLDLSAFVIKDIYKDLLNIDLEKLMKEYPIEHDAVNYFGLDINNILAAGYLRIGFNKYKNQFYIQFDTTCCFPSVKVFDMIENIFLVVDTLYISFGNTDNYAVFSIKNGDSIKDIKHYFNRNKF